MTRRQSHLLDVGNIPRRYDYAPRIGIVLYKVDCLRYLVDASPVGAAPRPPLIAVNVIQIAESVALYRRLCLLLRCLQKRLVRNWQYAVLYAQLVVVAVGVVVPDMHAVIDEVFYVGVALQKP